jgi:hypothetical protein
MKDGLTSRFWEEYYATGIDSVHILLVNTAYIMVGYVVGCGERWRIW